MAGNVLIVDGSTTAGLRAQLILESAGYGVTVATDGDEGLVKALEEAPDLVVLDTVLPTSSGYEVCGRLKIDPKTEHLPIVLAADEVELAALRDQVGFHPERFVAKPYDPTSLLPRVGEAIAGGNGYSSGNHGAGKPDGSSFPAIAQMRVRGERIATANRAAGELLGSEPEALVGKSLTELLPDAGEMAEIVASDLPDQARWADCRVRVNGGEDAAWWRICATPASDGTDEVELALVDVSEYARLRDELEVAHQAAEDGSRTRSRFLANMSHELRTPLHEIIGMLDLSLDADRPEEQTDYLATARSSAEALLTIVSDVLEFSELEAGELELEEETFDVREPIERVEEVLAPRAEEKGVEFSSRVAAGVPKRVHGASRRVRQVLAQLAENAVKFTDRGQVSLWVEAEAYRDSQVELHFRVRDTGAGIPQEKQQVIFEAFRQADDSSTRPVDGLGLGLATSWHLVQLMGGRLWVESEEGKGSTFHVVLPFGVPPEEAKPEAAPAADDGAFELKILVAEDSPTNQLIARKNLEKAGHRVTIANNGREAVEAVARERWDLVLMDVAMPEMDGLEATMTIREVEQETGHHVPIIATTAFATKEYRDRCAEAGMDGYVSKPVSVDELYETIEPFLVAKAAGADVVEAEIEVEADPPVDFEAALEVVGGDVELLEAVSEMSLSEIPETLDRLGDAVADGNASGVEAGAHRIKGVLSNLGGTAARDVAQRLETMGEEGELVGADDAFEELAKEAQRVVAFYAAYDW